MTDVSATREFYQHEPECDIPKDLTEVNYRGIRGCLNCGGSFKADGVTGWAITSTIFDEDHPPRVIPNDN